MRKLLFFFVLTMITACSVTKNCVVQTDDDALYGMAVHSSITSKIDTFTIAQLDSMIKADKLPSFSKWKQTQYVDAETNQPFIYKTIFDKTTNITYTVKVYNNLYIVKKRMIK